MSAVGHYVDFSVYIELFHEVKSNLLAILTTIK